MKLSWKREILPVVLLLVMVVAAVHYYPSLPNPVPSHFGANGEPNGWMSKPVYLTFNLGQFMILYLLLTFLPFIDPLKKKVAPRFKVVLLLRDVVLLFTVVMFFRGMVAAREGSLSLNMPEILVGVLLAVLGNFLPKMPQNWFFGIRTPWALSSEIVWKKTNIMGGWLMTLSGGLWIVCAILKFDIWIPITLLVVVVLWTYTYSFLVYKDLEHSGRLGDAKTK